MATIVMRYEECLGWRISFRDPANPDTLFREYTFAAPEKIEELVARTATPMQLENRQALEKGLRNGSGALTLVLTGSQYQKLLR